MILPHRAARRVGLAYVDLGYWVKLANIDYKGPFPYRMMD